MAEIRLSKLTKQFNIGLQTLVDFLKEKGAEVEMNPNAKISDSYLPAIESKFGDEQKLKQDSEKVAIKLKEIIEMGAKKKAPEEEAEANVKEVIIKSNLSSEAPAGQSAAQSPAPAAPVEETGKENNTAEKTVPVQDAAVDKQVGHLKIIGEIDLSQFDRKHKPKESRAEEKKAETPAPAPVRESVSAPVKEEKTAPAETKAAETPVQESKPASEAPARSESKEAAEEPRREVREIKIEVEKLQGPKIVDKIDLSQFDRKKNKKRERIAKGGSQKVDVTKIGDEQDNSSKKDKG